MTISVTRFIVSFASCVISIEGEHVITHGMLFDSIIFKFIILVSAKPILSRIMSPM